MCRAVLGRRGKRVSRTVHATLAGKSSLLNVLLEEEDILPTNGMRASTSCPVEVSYHPDKSYHATIEFMSKVGD